VDVLVRGLKFHGRLDHAAVLGGLLAEALIAGGVADPAGAGAGGRPDLILPMPLHDNRLKERGFNQAAELALVVSRATRIPFAPAGTAVRSRDTAAQSGLDRAKRAANVRGAFAASPAVRGLRIAVLDDVVTTGATAGELARVLKRAGAKAVTLWAVCAA
jgi:ComF family protein